MKKHLFQVFSFVAILALMLVALPMQSAQAATPTDLFFSEYIEGSSNNKALEIYNDTGGAVDLAAGEYVIQFFFNGSTSAGTTINLTGTVADGDVYVVADNDAVSDILNVADQTSTSNFYNGDDVIILWKGGVGSSIVDSIGQLGTDPGSEWAGGGANDTLRRKATVCAGDTNPDDSFDFSVEWDSFAQDTFNGLGTHTANCGGGPSDPVINEFSASTTGADVEYIEVFGDPSTDYSAFTVIEIEGDSTKGVIDHTFSVGTTDGGGFWTTSVGNLGIENGTITLLLVEGFTGSVGDDIDGDDNGVIDFTPWTRVVDAVAVNDGGSGDLTYGVPVLGPNYDGVSSYAPGGASRIPDGLDTDAASDWVRNDFDLFGIPGFPGSPALGEAENTPGAANVAITVLTDPIGECGDPATLIHDIQGSGLASADVGSIREVQGIVTGDFEASNQLGGFFMQEETADYDANSNTSEGIFVFNDGVGSVSPGDTVRVRGTVAEYFDLTELNNVVSVTICPATGTTASVPWSLPVTAVSDWEWVEGMEVTINQTLYASGNYTWARYGEIDLSVGAPLDNPTNVVAPGAPAIALQDLNNRSRIQLDDGSTVQNPLPYPPYLGVGNTQRTGDTIPGLTGNVSYSFGVYEIEPTQPVNFTRVNARPGVPNVGGTMQVASFNVLNYFTTIDNGSPICGPLSNQDCRGADSASEFTRQRDKIVTAISKLDAEVVGLMEIENAPDNTPEANLVAGLNAATAPGTYNYIAAGPIGSDAIRVALLYKPAAVTPVGTFGILDSSVNPLFDDTLNRPMLTQSFMENATGAVFTVSVNHLKSKGSDCNDVGDPDIGDGQGNCNITRTNAAQAIVDYLASDPTGVGDSDYLVIGDMNSYAKEDPISTMKAGGYTDLIEMFQGVGFADSAYSYNFESQSGYLDHGLSSRTMMPQVTGAAFWHVNADEPSGLDYNNYNQPLLYNPDEFRSSDHDPVIIGIDMTAEQVKELIDDVQALVDDGSLNGGQGNALTSKLENVLAKLAKGNTNAAANQLGAFINQIEAYVNGGILTSEQVEPLITSASLLVEFLSK
jgi:predicted extracellular nuclease